MLAGALVAADDALDVLLAVDLGSAVAALRVGAVGLGAGRGAAAAGGLSLDAGEHLLAAVAVSLDQRQHVRVVTGGDAPAGVVSAGGASIGAGQAGEILLNAAAVVVALVEARRQILLDHRRLLAGHTAGRGLAPARGHTASAGGGAPGGQGSTGTRRRGVQVAAQRGGVRLVPGAVRRDADAQTHGPREPKVEGGQLGAGLGARVEEAGSRGRGGAHDAATVHAQRVVSNNFGGRLGTRVIIAGIHFRAALGVLARLVKIFIYFYFLSAFVLCNYFKNN